ncbi:MAG: OmpA family protein [Arenimonas sp.]|nr:OmpA family protein [Arenimonas sp.]MBP6626769.1 OmpA family protein [Arenimonas sp.]
MHPILRIACLSLLALAAGPIAAQDLADLPDGTDVKGSSDHPLIQRFEGSSIRFSEKKAYSDLVLSLNDRTDPATSKTKVVEGVRTTLLYVMPADVSTLEALRAYQEELEKLGEVTVLFQGVEDGSRSELGGAGYFFAESTYGLDAVSSSWMSWNDNFRYAALKVARPDGDMYVSIYAGLVVETSGAKLGTIAANRVGVRLDIAEPKPRAQRMVTVSSAEMSAEIAKNGRVSLYGILFDTAKADLKPESDAALVQIGELMKADPKLRLLVVGHTDTVGAFEGNRDLSQRRAKAVVAALVAKHGVQAARLQSFGASFAAPVASNADEAGRAKNRRVELVSF